MSKDHVKSGEDAEQTSTSDRIISHGSSGQPTAWLQPMKGDFDKGVAAWTAAYGEGKRPPSAQTLARVHRGISILNNFLRNVEQADLHNKGKEGVAAISPQLWSQFTEQISSRYDAVYVYKDCRRILLAAADELGIELALPMQSISRKNPKSSLSSQMANTRPKPEQVNNFVVFGRTRRDVGHGTKPWKMDCSRLANGRTDRLARSAYRGRPTLAAQVLPALRAFASTGITLGTFQGLVQAMDIFWIFEEDCDRVMAAAGQTSVPVTLEQIPGTIWALYSQCLIARTDDRAHAAYRDCARVFNRAAEIANLSEPSLGFPLPNNPFEDPQSRASKPSDQTDSWLEPETAKAAVAALLACVRRTDARLRGGSERGTADAEWEDLKHKAEAVGWNSNLLEISPGNLALMPEPTDLESNGGELIVQRLWNLVPHKRDLEAAFTLAMIRNGWNVSTTQAIVAGNWSKPVDGMPGVVRIFSPKTRGAAGRLQYAYCMKGNPEHAFTILSAVEIWTEPLRVAVKQEIARLKEQDSLSDDDRMRLDRLWGLQNRLWLYLNLWGEIAALDDVRYDYVNEQLRLAGVTHKGKSLEMKQALSRDGFAIFVLESSGQDLIVTQLALGHADLRTLLSYIRNKVLINRSRKAFVDLLERTIVQVTNGRLDLRRLSALVTAGAITKQEEDVLKHGGYPTRHGLACADPRRPDEHIEPDPKGGLCRSQNCLLGCSRAFVTLDTLDFLALEIERLRGLKEQMPLSAWVASEFPHDLQIYESMASKFSKRLQGAAFKKAKAAGQPVIHTLPSRLAVPMKAV